MEKSVVILILSIPWISSVKICNDCNGVNCERSIPCYQGECDEKGQCICNACYHGDSCDVYEDAYPPMFYTLEEEVYLVNPWTSQPVYQAQAYDNDYGYTCFQVSSSCDCGSFYYQLIDEKNYFSINNVTGEVFVKEPVNLLLTPIYSVLIKASSLYHDQNNDHPLQNFQKVVFHLEREKDVWTTKHQRFSENVLYNESHIPQDNTVISLRRQKRDITANNQLTSFELFKVDGDDKSLEIGKSVHYKLVIDILQTDKLDLIVELFTKQISNTSYIPTLALYDVHVEPQADGTVTYSLDPPKIEMVLSDQLATVFDRVVINFGDITNTEEKGQIIVKFSVTQIKNLDTTYQQPHYVTAGAEYDNENFVWVGQAEIIPQEAKKSDDTSDVTAKVTGPSSLPLDSAGIFHIDALVLLRSETVTVEVQLENNDALTIGNLGVLEFGEFYSPVPQDIYHYNTTFVGSTMTCLNTKAILELGLMTNIGPLGKDLNDEKNKIRFTFAVYALNKPSNVGGEITITTGVLVGDRKLWTSLVNVSLENRVKDSGPKITAKKTIGFSSGDVGSPGSLMAYTLYTEVDNAGGYFEYIIKIEVPKENDLIQMEPCGARLMKAPLSFNIPYVPCDVDVEPQYDGDKTFIFKFSRIHITDQHKPPKLNDTLVMAEVVVKIATHSESTSGTNLQMKLAVMSADDYVDIPLQSIEVQETEDQPVPTVKVKNAASWDMIYADGAISFDIMVTVKPGVGYGGLIFESSGDEDAILQMCKIELIDIGSNLPCLQIHRNDVNQNITYSMLSQEDRTKNNRGRMKLGDVGAVSRPEDVVKNTFVVNVVASLIPGSSFDDDTDYDLTAGMTIGPKLIWASEVKYTMSTDIRTVEAEKVPKANAEVVTTEIAAGYSVDILITITTSPDSIGQHKISVKSKDDTSSVCILQVKYAGKNLPCVDYETPATYIPHSTGEKGVEISTVEFKALSNIGRPDSNDTRENTLIMRAAIQISKFSTDDQTINWEVDYGSAKIAKDLVIPLKEGSVPKMSGEDPKSANLSLSETETAIGAPFFVTLDLELKEFFLSPITVKVLNPDSMKHPYDVCLAGITSYGVNYPCFNPSNLVTTIPSPDKTHNDTADIDFGLVCNSFIDRENFSENVLQLHVAVRPVEDKSILKHGDKISITEHLIIGSKTITSLPVLKIKAVKEAPDINPPKEVIVKAINGTDISIKVRERLWVPFNITIFPESVVKVSVEANGPVRNKRAVLTVHGLRLVSGGPNVPCPLASANFDYELISTVPTAQNDTVKAVLGYFGNLGITHVNGAEGGEGDDDITVEVEVELTDHPDTDHKSKHMLDFTVTINEVKGSAQQPFLVERTGDEKADLHAIVLVDNSRVYQSGETIPMFVSLKHTDTSRAEPSEIIVRLYIPPYVIFNVETYSNPTKPIFKNESGGLDIVFQSLTFPDEVEVNFTVLADPYKQRKHGKGIVNATTPYRILGLQTSRSEPIQNPAKDILLDCTSKSYLMYEINSAECDEKLGISDPDIIMDCQLTASSAPNKDWAPYYARLGMSDNKAWSPPIRVGSFNPYLQVDFLHVVRVGRVVFQKVEGTRYITKCILVYSDTGLDWKSAAKIDVNFEDDLATVELSMPVKGRYFRVIITDNNDIKDLTTYIGVRIEMYGCHVDQEIYAKCDPDKTWYTNDMKKPGRHMTVDTETQRIYFCDALDDPSNKMCYSCDDSSCQVLPQNIGYLLGYDETSKMVCAIDNRYWAVMCTNDSTHFIAVEKQKMDNMKQRDTFSWFKNIPALSQSDLGNIKEGEWTATVDGLRFNNDYRIKWDTCCSK